MTISMDFKSFGYSPDQLRCRYCRWLEKCLVNQRIPNQYAPPCGEFEREPGTDDD